MSIYIIAVALIVIIIIVAVLMAKGAAGLDTAVQKNRETIDRVGVKFNTALTQGFQIPVTADFEIQLKKARQLAAEKAAATPRGGNFGIGRLGQANELKTAWKGVDQDPMTAVKIAAFHGWDGLSTGAVVSAPVAAAPTTPVPAAGDKIKLISGKDYPVLEITADMSPAEKRKARIANAKAKSAAMKAAKAAGAAGAAPAPIPSAAKPPPVTAPSPPVSIPEPELIEITDDMAPDEKRKARIANSKAKSAYKKALKSAGVDTKVTASAPSPSQPPKPAAAIIEEASAVVPPPELIELTDAMAPEEKRAARIANSKAKSAYKKALKAAGVDPSAL